MVKLGFFILLWASQVLSNPVWSSQLGYLDERFTQSEQTGLLLVSPNGFVFADKDAQALRVPASTTKLLTAYLALQHWGLNYQFTTPFFLRVVDKNPPLLVIKGQGDPFLVSEELQGLAFKLAEQLKQQGIRQLGGVILDATYYDENPVLPGRMPSLNPYDALPSALSANFNTVNVRQLDGKVVSAEAQTPLTATALTLANRFFKTSNKAVERFNTGNLRQTGEHHFAELLRIFLQQNAIAVSEQVAWGRVLKSDLPIYQHQNSKNLADMIVPMMRYSTNFIANQLALNLSAEVLGVPASAEKVLRFYQQALQDLGWQGAMIEEGAGLSAHNRLSPQHLIDLLERFAPYKSLLPEIEPNIFAKSGSLIGVSTLAGYIRQENAYWPFALMMNEKMPYHYRNLVAKQLRDSLP